MNKISLCSFTYNDANLLHGLLAAIPAWPTQPDEIILVDDGSDEPFELDAEEKKLPIRLLRLDKNIGFRAAKHLGLSSATGDVIVSLDCDSRITGDYIGNASRLLADPSIGLVGPMDGGYVGTDMLSLYCNNFAVIIDPVINNSCTFINGAAFALRREVWEKIGGFSRHTDNTGEDHYLCSMLKNEGLRLVRDPEITLRGARRLTRFAFCRRPWKWCAKGWLAELSSEKSLAEYLKSMIAQTRFRITIIVAEHPPAWVYFDLLGLTYIFLEFCNALGAEGKIPATAGKDLLTTLDLGLKRFPALYRLLKSDLLRIGVLPLKPARAPDPANNSRLAASCVWTDFEAFIAELEETLVLEYLDKVGVREILEDEAALESSFSSY